MKILVVGKSGQVALSLADQANLFSHELICIGRPDLDLAQSDTIRAAVSDNHPDIVINAAAFTQVDAAEDETEAAYTVNSTGPQHLAELTNGLNVPVIHISTDYVFDGNNTQPYTEDDEICPLGVYGASKAQGERAIREHNRQHIILRTAWVFSPFGNNFAKTMLRLAHDHDQVRVVNDQTGTPTYAPHIANAILRVCDQIESAKGAFSDWGTYNLVAEGQTNWAEFASKIFEISAEENGPHATVTQISTLEFPTKAKRPAYSCLRTTKLFDTFGFRLPSWEIGVSEFIQAQRNAK